MKFNDQKKLLEEFSFMVNKDNKLVFLANDNTLYDVLDFISKNKISLTKLEKLLGVSLMLVEKEEVIENEPEVMMSGNYSEFVKNNILPNL